MWIQISRTDRTKIYCCEIVYTEESNIRDRNQLMCDMRLLVE